MAVEVYRESPGARTGEREGEGAGEGDRVSGRKTGRESVTVRDRQERVARRSGGWRSWLDVGAENGANGRLGR